MKMIICLAALVAVALAAPVEEPATILRYENDNIGVEGYSYNFETSDGVSREEKGEIKNAGTDDESLSVKGKFSYLGSDGVEYLVTYVADENGFQPEGTHIPKN